MADDSISFRGAKPSIWTKPARGRLSIRNFIRPAEAATPDSASNARTAAAAMLIAFALFALFDSQGIRHFTRDLPGNVFTDMLVNNADRWHALMEGLGPAKVAPALRHAFERVHKMGW